MSILRARLAELSNRSSRFLLAEGVSVSAAAVSLGAGRPKGCHGNASQLARRWPARYRWWTGMVLLPEFDIPAEHSWIERAGEHLEVTLPVAGDEYLGVPVPLDFLQLVVGHPIDSIAFAHSVRQQRLAELASAIARLVSNP